MASVMLLCLLAGCAAFAEEGTYTPDGYGLLSFGMSMDDFLALNDNKTAQELEAVAMQSSDTAARLVFALTGNAGQEAVKRDVYCDFEEGRLVCARKPLSADEGVYSAVSDVLAKQYGEPMFSSAQGTRAEAPEYSDPLYGLTEDTDIIVEIGANGVYSYAVQEYEQWVLPMPDGTQMLIHHMQYVKTNYMYDEYSKEAEAITTGSNAPRTVHILQFLPL